MQCVSLLRSSGYGPPSNVLLSASNYLPPTRQAGEVVGVVSGTSPNAGDTLSFALAAGDSIFGLVSATTVVVLAAGQTGTPLSVTVRVTNQAGFFDRTFSITDRELSCLVFCIALHSVC